MQHHFRRSAAAGAAIGIDVPGSHFRNVHHEIFDRNALERMLGRHPPIEGLDIGFGQNHRHGIAVDGQYPATAGQCHRISPNAAAQVGKGRLLRKSTGFVGRDGRIGGLFQSARGEEHSVGLWEFFAAFLPQLALLEDPVRPGRRKFSSHLPHEPHERRIRLCRERISDFEPPGSVRANQPVVIVQTGRSGCIV